MKVGIEEYQLTDVSSSTDVKAQERNNTSPQMRNSPNLERENTCVSSNVTQQNRDTVGYEESLPVR
jgi:hypothetical protein